MIGYFRSLSPLQAPASVDPEDKLKLWQERILQTLFLVGGLFGLVFTLLFVASSFRNHTYAIFISAIGLMVISLTFFALRKLSYWVRSIVALAIIFVVANLVYFNSGWTGISILLLLLFSFLSTTLLYTTPSRIGLFLSLTTLLVWATLRFTNIVQGVGLAFTVNSLGIDLLIVLLTGITINLVIASIKSRYLEINSLNRSLREEKDTLTQKMDEQTSILERRVTQLKTAAEITKSISSIVDPQLLIRQVSDAVRERFALYYVGVFLIDPMKEFAVLQYGTGEAGRKMMANRHRLAVGGYSMIGWTTHTRKARIALDIGAEAVHFDNPLLPETRSELALPIATTANIYGAMTIQSEKQGAFDENDILVLQSIADNLAIALENNSSFEKTQKTLEEIRVLNKAFVQQAWGEALAVHGDLEAEFENSQLESGAGSTRSVQVPLYLRDEVIGQIDLEVVGDTLDAQQMEFLESISSQTSSALENARLIDESQRTASRQQKLNELSEQFSRALTIEDILKTAVQEFGHLPSVSEATISLLPPEETNLGKNNEKRGR
ncbi:MAG: GAF domain-containing protein [Anaerolineaceae bacterium]|nr:GAF domain-containing protein [Anaerolineaceae bacterium]